MHQPTNHTTTCRPVGMISIDVEEWFHILDSPAAPSIGTWDSLESRVEQSLDKILATLDANGVRATFFWLGWVAERHPSLVKRCHQEGHEIASHGYAHVLANQVGQERFAQDIRHGKAILEDMIGQAVKGFRAAGFSITYDTPWAFTEISKAGFRYDSSIFPAPHGHGGVLKSPLFPFLIETESGNICELPISVINILGKRTSMFGGGYLRLFPIRFIRWGIEKLKDAGHPLIIYLHPREVDLAHPRLPLSWHRRFKSYVNLKSTMPKLRWLCQNYSFCPMHAFSENFFSLNSSIL
jgi:polysaccharide deacetylase family protein (PEP-CTERM system associated)